jgi:Ca2+-binding EF-hand superfamily protein
MKRNLQFSFVALGAAILLAALVDASASDKRGDRADRMWQELDADKDGRISKAEADAGKRGHLSEHFSEIDSNQDGFVTREEMQAKRAAMRSQMRDKAQQKWQEADLNSDGQLSLDEAQAKLPRVAQRFNELDGDKNGYLTQEELRAGHRGGKHRKP